MVAVNRRRRRVLVGDVTAQPDMDHLAKTIAYARRLVGQLPPDLRGYRVLAQDWYWALPPELQRGSWPTSKRIIVRPDPEGEGFTPRVLSVIANYFAGNRRDPRFRAGRKSLNKQEARQALKTGAGVFLLGANKDQAYQWILSQMPATVTSRLEWDEAHRPGGRGHWHIGRDHRFGHVFYGPSRPRRSW